MSESIDNGGLVAQELRLVLNTQKKPPAWEIDPYASDLQGCFRFLVFQEASCPWLINGEHPPEDLRIRQLTAGIFIREQMAGARDFHYEPLTPRRLPRGTAPTARAGGHLWTEFYKLAAILYVNGHSSDHPLIQMCKLIHARSGFLLPWCLPDAEDINPWNKITRENSMIRGKVVGDCRVVDNPYKDCRPSREWIDTVLALQPFNMGGTPDGLIGKMLLQVLKARKDFAATWKPSSKKNGGKGYRTTPCQ